MSETQDIQDTFLTMLSKEKVPVSIFLINGIKLQGHVNAFDKYVIMLKGNVIQKIYKHAIATIVPAYELAEK